MKKYPDNQRQQRCLVLLDQVEILGEQTTYWGH